MNEDGKFYCFGKYLLSYNLGSLETCENFFSGKPQLYSLIRRTFYALDFWIIVGKTVSFEIEFWILPLWISYDFLIHEIIPIYCTLFTLILVCCFYQNWSLVLVVITKNLSVPISFPILRYIPICYFPKIMV